MRLGCCRPCRLFFPQVWGTRSSVTSGGPRPIMKASGSFTASARLGPVKGLVAPVSVQPMCSSFDVSDAGRRCARRLPGAAGLVECAFVRGCDDRVPDLRSCQARPVPDPVGPSHDCAAPRPHHPLCEDALCPQPGRATRAACPVPGRSRALRVGLEATRAPHLQPWRLPMHELAGLVGVSFLDLAKVVTAHACGLQRTGLEELLFGPDRIEQSMDAHLRDARPADPARGTRPVRRRP
ncbi:hypothetical protein QFZ43_000200 [Streptomyces afghaniensis]|nr:hypothetical protein [Streptomyces afghaniensis]